MNKTERAMFFWFFMWLACFLGLIMMFARACNDKARPVRFAVPEGYEVKEYKIGPINSK